MLDIPEEDPLIQLMACACKGDQSVVRYIVLGSLILPDRDHQGLVPDCRGELPCMQELQVPCQWFKKVINSINEELCRNVICPSCFPFGKLLQCLLHLLSAYQPFRIGVLSWYSDALFSLVPLASGVPSEGCQEVVLICPQTCWVQSIHTPCLPLPGSLVFPACPCGPCILL